VDLGFVGQQCPLSGVKRTSGIALHMSAFDPKRTQIKFLPQAYPLYRGTRISSCATLSRLIQMISGEQNNDGIFCAFEFGSM
jgi:hypothetical protein